MVEVVIKKVQLDDINQLQKIGRQTFYATFSDKNTEENMELMKLHGLCPDDKILETGKYNASYEGLI